MNKFELNLLTLPRSEKQEQIVEAKRRQVTHKDFWEQQSEKKKKMPEDVWVEKDLCFYCMGGDVNWTQISYLKIFFT